MYSFLYIENGPEGWAQKSNHQFLENSYEGLNYVESSGAWEYASYSWEIGEQAAVSPWRPIIYPFKMVIPVSLFLLLIQGISELLKSLYASFKGEWP